MPSKIDRNAGDKRVKRNFQRLRKIIESVPTGITPNPQTYTVTNVSTDRTFDANSTTVNELADVLGTLIADLEATGII